MAAEQISECFEQPSFIRCVGLERLFPYATTGQDFEDDKRFICEESQGDIDCRRRHYSNQLTMLQDACRSLVY
jgi:hypothetical protein